MRRQLKDLGRKTIECVDCRPKGIRPIGSRNYRFQQKTQSSMNYTTMFAFNNPLFGRSVLASKSKIDVSRLK